MKKIFLIGDSIRIGYDSIVREIMQDEAQVYWSNDNARFTAYTFRYLTDWSKSDCDPEKIDFVHWNNGLWDALHIMGDDCQTPLGEYQNGVLRIARRVKRIFPNAQVAFAYTTSVVESRMGEQFYRRNADIRQYNEAARRVLEDEGVMIDDLYTVAAEMSDDLHAPDGTHFTPEGYRVLAEAVADFIRKRL